MKSEVPICNVGSSQPKENGQGTVHKVRFDYICRKQRGYPNTYLRRACIAFFFQLHRRFAVLATLGAQKML